MKQYTTPEQTAKLIKLGFEKPKSIGGYEPTFIVEYDGVEASNIIIGENKQEPIYAYSIGELIELLQQYLEYSGGVVDMEEDYYSLTIRRNKVMYCDPYMDWIEVQWSEHEELIDNLFDACIALKEEGVI